MNPKNITGNKRGSLTKNAVIVLLAVLCFIQGIVLYRDKSTDNVDSSSIDKFSSSILKKFNQERQNRWNNFDSFFNDDFFKMQKDPFEEMEKFHKRMQKMMEETIGGDFDHTWNTWLDDRFSDVDSQIDFDSEETDNGYIYTLKTNHLKDNDIKIDIDENSISINGEFTQKLEKKDKNGNIISQQERMQKISQQIPIPSDADYRKAEVKKKEDRIIIKIPRK